MKLDEYPQIFVFSFGIHGTDIQASDAAHGRHKDTDQCNRPERLETKCFHSHLKSNSLSVKLWRRSSKAKLCFQLQLWQRGMRGAESWSWEPVHSCDPTASKTLNQQRFIQLNQNSAVGKSRRVLLLLLLQSWADLADVQVENASFLWSPAESRIHASTEWNYWSHCGTFWEICSTIPSLNFICCTEHFKAHWFGLNRPIIALGSVRGCIRVCTSPEGQQSSYGASKSSQLCFSWWIRSSSQACRCFSLLLLFTSVSESVGVPDVVRLQQVVHFYSTQKCAKLVQKLKYLQVLQDGAACVDRHNPIQWQNQRLETEFFIFLNVGFVFAKCKLKPSRNCK